MLWKADVEIFKQVELESKRLKSFFQFYKSEKWRRRIKKKEGEEQTYIHGEEENPPQNQTHLVKVTCKNQTHTRQNKTYPPIAIFVNSLAKPNRPAKLFLPPLQNKTQVLKTQVPCVQKIHINLCQSIKIECIRLEFLY